MREQLTSLKAEIDDRVVLADLDGYMAGFNAGAIPATLMPLNMTVSNPPTRVQVQAIADQLDEILARLKRE